MYKKNVNYSSTQLKINNSVEGETLEQKVERIMDNKEPIKDGAPLIYTDRKDGVLAGYNIKTDRWEVAVDAMDKVAKTKTAQRENRAKMEVVKDGGAEPIQGTTSNGTNE
jgi:hypothetical protein